MTAACITEEAGTPEKVGAPPVVSPTSETKLSVALPWEREAMPLRILLADDHQTIRQHVRAILEQEGFEVAGEAKDGREAVQLAQRFSPDMVVLDVSMPALNGFRAAEEILRHAPQMRVILLTVHAESVYVVRAVEHGIRGYVVKTQMPDDLLAAIQAVAHGRIYISPMIAETAGLTSTYHACA